MDKRIFEYSLKTFLFLSPIFFFKEYQLTFARGLFFVLGTFALFGIALQTEPKRKLSNPWLCVIFLLALIRVFFDNNFGDSGAEWFNFWLNCAGFIYVFCGILLFYVVYCYVDSPKEYIKPIIWVCSLNFILALAQVFNYDFMWAQRPYGICGFMEASNQLGQYSAMATPILFGINPFLAVIPLSTLTLSQSISPILSGSLGILAFCFLKQVNKFVIIGIGIILILGFIAKYEKIKSKFVIRPVMWERTLRSALQRPYLGWGYQSFKEQVSSRKTEDIMGVIDDERAQNDSLHTAQELGFPIVIAIGMFFINLFKKFFGLKNKDKITYCFAISIFIILINMLGQPTIRFASIAGTFIVLLALFCIKVEENYARSF